jgi:hypothetical protein
MAVSSAMNSNTETTFSPSRRATAPECTTGCRAPPAAAYTAAVRVPRLVAVLLLAGLSTSCLVVSLHPVYDPETIAFDPALLGQWVADEDAVSVTFDRAEWHSYHLTLAEGDKPPARLSVRMTRVGETLLLDVTPLDGTDIGPLQLAVHAIYRVSLEGDTLSVWPLNYDSLFDRVRAGTADVPAVIDPRTNVVMTATTAELRRWLAAHLTDEGLFGAPVTMHRKGAPPAGP